MSHRRWLRLVAGVGPYRPKVPRQRQQAINHDSPELNRRKLPLADAQTLAHGNVSCGIGENPGIWRVSTRSRATSVIKHG